MGDGRGEGAHGQVRGENSLSSSGFICSGIEDFMSCRGCGEIVGAKKGLPFPRQVNCERRGR